MSKMPQLVVTDEDRARIAARMRPIAEALNALSEEMRAGAEHALSEVGAVLRKHFPRHDEAPPA